MLEVRLGVTRRQCEGTISERVAGVDDERLLSCRPFCFSPGKTWLEICVSAHLVKCLHLSWKTLSEILARGLAQINMCFQLHNRIARVNHVPTGVSIFLGLV